METLLKNRKANYNFEIVKTYSSGIILKGSEVKSLRKKSGNFGDSFCFFKKDGLYLKSLFIPEYKLASYNNHDPYRERKLLLKKTELKNLKDKITQKGMTIVPVSFVLNDNQKIKLVIAIAKGRKVFDKKEQIKQKDQTRDMNRELKNYV